METTTLNYINKSLLDNTLEPSDNIVVSLQDYDQAVENEQVTKKIEAIYTPTGERFDQTKDINLPNPVETVGFLGSLAGGTGYALGKKPSSGLTEIKAFEDFKEGTISEKELVDTLKKEKEQRDLYNANFFVNNPNIDMGSTGFNIGSSIQTVMPAIAGAKVGGYIGGTPGAVVGTGLGILGGAYYISTSEAEKHGDYFVKMKEKGAIITKERVEELTKARALTVALSGALDRLGLGKITNKKVIEPFKPLKEFALKTVGEGGTEVAQEGITAFIDFATGVVDYSKAPLDYMEDVYHAFTGGAFYSGVFNIADAIFYKKKAKARIKEKLGDFGTEEEREALAEEIFNGTISNMADFVNRELKANKELQEKHGDIMNSLSNQIAKQISDVGAFENMTESQKAVFIRKEANRFANQVIAESLFRKVPADDIVKASDVVYENGELYLKGTVLKAPSSKVKVKPNATADKDKIEYTPVGVSAPVMDEVVEIDGYDTVRLSGKNVPITYEIVEADTLLTSHSYLGTENPDYPKHLQNRNRGRKELVDQVTQMSANLDPALLGKSVTGTDGAPIITQDGNVAIGNGRANAIIRAYDTGNAEEYRNVLAKDYDITGFERPVLVRRFVDNYSAGTMRKLIEDANTPLTAGFSNSEQALTDAGRLTDNTLSLLNPDYEIDTATNRDFVNLAFNEIIPQSERGRYLDDSGYITEDGMKRIKASTLAKIVSDEKLLSSILESNDETIRKASQGVMEVSAKINMLESLIKKGQVKPEYSIKNDIQKAFKKYVEAKRSKQDTEVFLNNKDLFETDLTPAQQKVLDIFMKSRNSGEVKNRLARYVQSAVNEGDSTQARMFGEPLTKEQILDFDKLHQEQIELTETMQALDRVSPEYKGETININGVERSVYNSEGNRIAKSEKSLRAFYKWFGDSKVVDSKGRPLVVYHGTPNKFDTFDVERVGTQGTAEGNGFYFTTSKKFAQGYAKETWVEGERVPGNVMPVYLKIENPLEFGLVDGLRGISESKIREVGKIISDKYIKHDETRKTFNDVIDFAIQNGKEIDITETIAILQNNAEIIGDEINDTPGYEVAQDVRNIISKEFGVDGFFRKVKGHTVYIAFSPNQIKSVDNRGLSEIIDRAEVLNQSEDVFEQAVYEGVDLKIDFNDPELERLYNIQQTTNLGKNLYGEDFDKWVEDKITKDVTVEIDNYDIHDAEDVYGSLEDVNEEIIDNPENNSYNRKEPFTEEEFVEHHKTSSREGIYDTVQDRIRELDSYNWEKLRDEFNGSLSERYRFFDDVQDYIVGIMFDNGFYASTNKSRQSDSRYVKVYKDEDADEPFAQIRISDHYTRKFYGDNIVINTNKDLKEQIQGLKDAFAKGEFGVDESVFLQRAFVGSRTNWKNDKPSLEFIGTGEGNQAHGWGLYYALSKDVAEGYRENFTQNVVKVSIGETSIDDWVNSYEWYDDNFYVAENIIDDINWQLGRIKYFETEESKNSEARRIILSTIDSYVQDFSKKRNNDEFFEKRRKQNLKNISDLREEIATYNANEFDFVQEPGQVYEVEIPENPYLLDEQKSFAEQSDFVKEKMEEVFTELSFPQKKKVVIKDKDVAEELYRHQMDLYERNGYGYERLRPEVDELADGSFVVSFVEKYDFFVRDEMMKYWSGGNIYDAIADYLGSPKQASELLEKHGIKGITYEGRRDGRCFVIFNPDDVQVIDKFYQAQMVNDVVTAPQKPRQRKVVKGSFDAFKKSIGITKDADASTYAHEFSHFWVDSIWEHIESGNATEEYIKRFEGVMKYIGAERGKKLTKAQHEKFARAYEKYLFTAEVPRGVNPDVFDEYETFIRDVYDDITQIDTRAGEEYEPITEEVYNFFNSMTRDPLPRPRYLAEDVEFMKRQEEQLDKDAEEVQTERNKVIEARATFDEQDSVISEELREKAKELGIDVGENGTYTMQPVQTDNKTGFLTAYKKTTGQELEAGAMEQEAELKRATEFVNNNPELAEQIVMGNVPHPAGYSKNAIYIAYNELQKKLGNTDKRADALINQALELRAMGQEISIQRLVYGVDPAQFINAIVNERTDKVAKRNGIKTRKELSDKIKEGVKKGLNEGKTPDQIVDEMARGLALKPKPKSEKEPDTSIYGYKKALKYVEERLGVGMSKDEAVNIVRIVDDMNRNLENAKSKNQNPTIEYFIKLKELEDYVNTLAPSSNLRILVSVIGKANLLASVKSPVTNVVANIPTNLIMAGTRRVRLGVANSIVDSELTKRAKKEAWDIYKKTGYYIFSMDDPRRGTKQILSEDITNTSGSGVVKAYGRFMENLIFHWSMGAPDVMFKNFTFVDYASLKATKLANGDKAKANKLFEDACRIVPLTQEGKEIKNEAIQECLVATYQNKSILSEHALKARDALDFGVGFGEIIVPFVKTPANVIGTGLRYSVGGVKAIASEVVRGIQRGGFKLSDVTPENRSLLMDNTVGFLIGLALASFFDDEDYMPPYLLATTKERQLAKELNIAYNSVRIKGVWYSLDYAGVFASPLVAILQARRGDGILGKIGGFTGGLSIQSLSIPGFANISDLIKGVVEFARKDPEKAYSDVAGDVIEGVYNRAVPMIVSDIAKAMDDYEREAKTTEERIQSKIPVLREDLPEKVSLTTGQPEEMGNAFLDIVAGSRVKPQLVNDVADEFKRLSDAGYGVQLADVTQRGALSELEEEDKQSVREDFAKEYSRLVGNLIRGATYRRATDEEKSEMINKVRSKITKQLRNKYKNRRVK